MEFPNEKGGFKQKTRLNMGKIEYFLNHFLGD